MDIKGTDKVPDTIDIKSTVNTWDAPAAENEIDRKTGLLDEQRVDREKVQILLVDDQPARLLSYEAILGDLGENLVRATSGTEALQLLMRSEFALIILDVNMPGMDGFETASLIHNHPRFEKTPIIFVTAVHVTDLDRLRAYTLGAVDYVYIPVIPQILRSKVAVLVELYRKRRELQKVNLALEATNAELARANAILRAEKTRELEELNHKLEQANAELAKTNAALNMEVAERRRAQETLRENEERLRLALASAGSGAWDWEIQSGDLEVSGETIRLSGLDPQEFRGRVEDFERVLHPDDRLRILDLIGSLLSEKRDEFTGESRLLRPDGSVLWVSGRGRFFYDAQGSPLRMVGVCTDITERKRLEETLKDASRRKDEFLATLAHELRNPLNPIRNAVQLLHTSAQAEATLKWSRDVIDRQVDHLTRLIDDLLDVSRITRSKLELRKKRTELAQVIRSAVESSRPLIDQGGQQLVVTIPEEPLFLNADMIRLAQVFMNLLNNAAKYTPRGGRIALVAELESSGEEVVVRVQDNGVGIPIDKLPQVFDMFYQVDEGMEISQGGLGIGLTLVRHLTELHGGTVEARSAGVHQGSEFIVRIPLLTDGAPAAFEPTENHGEHRLPSGQRILIADDNRDSAESLAMLLRLSNNEVEIAYDGVEAVRKGNSFKPDVVLLDIGMPKLNGYEAARMIRARSWGKHALLIALTGWGQEENRRRSHEAGFDAHLIKPVDHSAFCELLARSARPR